MRNAGNLLCRPETQSADSEAEQLGSTAAAIRERLRLAAAGDWLKIVQDCLADLEKYTAVHARRPPRSATDPLDARTLQAAAQKAAHGSAKGAAAILTGGPPVPPGIDTDRKVAEFFHSQPRSAVEDAALKQALDAVSKLPHRTKAVIKPRTASHRCAMLKPAAGPGPGGFRNSFILCIHSHPQGPRALAAWATRWTQGAVAPWAAEMWTHALARPFFKGNMVDVRPVLCGEALLKFAMGCCVQDNAAAIAMGVGEHQFGAGRAGGASLEVSQVRAAATKQPDLGMATLDV